MRYSESTGCFYPEDIPYTSLPEDLVTVPQEDFELAMSRPLNTRITLVNGRIALEVIEKTVEEWKTEQEHAIRARYAEMLLSITRPYDKEERETWKTQEEEAKEYLADNSAPCSMIRAMASARGITVELLAQKITTSAERFRQASGAILGMQQAELDELYPELKFEI